MFDKVPHISIITVCLNSVKFIETAINSVNNQHFKNREHIVIDGGSTDGTVDILKKFQDQQILSYVSEPDGGIYEAMNKGIKLATGKWIFFLGSDDIFFDDMVLERVFCEVEKNAKIIYGNVKYLHSGIIYDGPFDQEKISKKNICHQSILFQRIIFYDLGFFNLKYKICADYEFNLRWMGAEIANLYINETLVTYNEKGISGRKLDDVFNNDFENLLIESNIISTKSFSALKKKYSILIHSNRFKVGNVIITPFVWIKNKIFLLKK